MKRIVASACSLLFVLGCKSKDKDKEPPPAPPPHTDPVPTTGSATGSGSASSIVLGAGETYYGGAATATNLVSWKLEDGSTVQLAIVTTGKTTDGRDEAALRAYRNQAPSYEVGQRISIDASKDHWAELKAVPNNRVLFRYGADGESRSARNAMLLRWDAPSERVVIAKRWSGVFKDMEPDWLMKGSYASGTTPAANTNCLKVIARMVECEKDPAFRVAMFARAKADDRPAMQAHFDTHVAKWRTADEAKAQCNRWATDDYAETHFADPVKLMNLAKDTAMKCDEFAREVVDDGGLPVAMTDAKPH